MMNWYFVQNKYSPSSSSCSRYSGLCNPTKQRDNNIFVCYWNLFFSFDDFQSAISVCTIYVALHLRFIYEQYFLNNTGNGIHFARG